MARRRRGAPFVDLVEELNQLAAFGGLVISLAGLLSGRVFLAVGALVVAVVLLLGRRVLSPRDRLGPWERRRLRRYFRAQLVVLKEQLPAGLPPMSDGGITLGDFVGSGGLFAEPEIEQTGATETNSAGVVDWLAREVAASGSVLLLGDPGVGKTLVCELTHRELVRRFVADPKRERIPWLLRLVEVGELIRSGSETSPHLLIETALAGRPADGDGDGVPLSADRIHQLLRADRIILLLDGLDELAIHGGAARDVIPRELAEVLRGRVVLTCRQTFFDLYMAASEPSRWFVTRANLRGVDFQVAGRSFVRAYCAKFGLDSAETVIATIESSTALTDLVSRPLLLFMATDVLANRLGGVPAENAGRAPEPDEWNAAEVYDLYVSKWLHLERRRGMSVHWQDMQELAERVAWRIYQLAFDGRKAFGQFDVHDLLIGGRTLNDVVRQWRPDESPDEAFRELTLRSFLVRSEGDDYYRFVHKSFFEFFAARYIQSVLINDQVADDVLLAVLLSPLPDEMIDFTRQLLDRCAGIAIEARSVCRNLFHVLEVTATTAAGSHSAIMARQQAANLLPLVLGGDQRSQDRLREIHANEPHPFVRRGIAVGFALHLDDGSLIDRLVSDFDDDPDSLIFHLGYNRIYYGDQEASNSGWRDDGTDPCDRLFLASLRQLRSSAYEQLWPMSLYTIRVLLADPGRRAYLDRAVDIRASVDELLRFAFTHKDDARESLTRECRRLVALLMGPA
ncbi:MULTISPECIES: NACHT domain-containing NTPase [unclassified Parafrankia]|uniref:NACHT domain-containing protein n=1 Tax=unclassified Parafrankia TaxID=2994368 RepID=UPI000DA45846|nr:MULTISPECIES: hypothetical protein [unclassified Parafrankia]TCJ32360.1 hypothetical protein E0504_43295 [Parafrankia sp. BMG5.11]CAI7978064.1 AAA domain-containing protein [Frankia sp. Hr75.2]SQD98583.1 hypothetical protein FMEAI12_4800005 [Parafrankia sp. Ea1.12]